MKLFMSAAVLCFLMAPVSFAHQQQQQEQQQDERTKKQQEEERQKQNQDKQAEKNRQEQQQQDERARQQDRARQDKQQQTAKQQQKDVEKQQKEQEKQQKQQEKEQRDNRQYNRGNEPVRSDQHAAYHPRHGRAIPEEKFHADFGREHHFHVGHHEHDRRFQYGGYWFEYEQPWPAEWSDNDDFYIDYIDDDYYLCDYERPGIRVLVIVVD